MELNSRACTKCGIVKVLSEFRANRAYHDGHTRQCIACTSARRRERYHAEPTAERAVSKEWATANRARIYARAAERRVQALGMYSSTPEPSCACCGEADLPFLTFEHINGGGAEQRRKTGGGGHLSWLLAEKRPDIEVLCMNCNHGRRVNSGVCPHVDAARLEIRHAV